MDAVVLTFPGHFFQTALTIRSCRQWYPEIDRLFLIIDDVQSDPWKDYEKNLVAYLNDIVPGFPIEIIRISDNAKLSRCVAGWWRQQLVKLTLDQLVPGERWFVIDGDVEFLSRCEIRDSLPISRHGDHNSNFSRMSVNYVKNLLNTDLGYIEHDGRQVTTNAVPFRHLDGKLLSSLRQHVEAKFNKEFVDLHLDWFDDQTIVADIDPPDRMVMTEWELIEAYQRYVQKVLLPIVDAGSGYGFDIDVSNINDGYVYRHAYQRDTERSLDWWQQQNIPIPTAIWQQARQWYQAQEGHRLE